VETIIAWMAADLGSDVIVLSKWGTITRPVLVAAVAAGAASELSPVPAEL
jgi:hypothetical protein